MPLVAHNDVRDEKKQYYLPLSNITFLTCFVQVVCLKSIGINITKETNMKYNLHLKGKYVCLIICQWCFGYRNTVKIYNVKPFF